LPEKQSRHCTESFNFLSAHLEDKRSAFDKGVDVIGVIRRKKMKAIDLCEKLQIIESKFVR